MLVVADIAPEYAACTEPRLPTYVDVSPLSLPGVGGMPRILLVEDDKDVRLLVEHVLILERYEVDAAATLEAARRLLTRNHFDLLLTDAALPDGTGVELARQAEERGIPVIVMTAYAFRFGDEILRFQMLLKPVRPAELSKAVGRALGLALPLRPQSL